MGMIAIHPHLTRASKLVDRGAIFRIDTAQTVQRLRCRDRDLNRDIAPLARTNANPE
ncbi:hypothetical protein [Mesorhizobium sp. CO1-1-8]|uniref:hypothetical protein n=1 Tax=Mesorhizobium sp. CO1-1-8 TaxID=2876631 RepID=UPI001CD14B95|nr:hypothetical protein [Mesorhizobium sp. CO1-1-8]MBZ9772270.1 hypothetical protein [Mesorhizobium sp. CO1-1-8]